MFGILREFRRLLERLEHVEIQTSAHREALQGLTGAIRDLANAQREAGPSADRLDLLERHRVQFEADVEGLLLKAEGKLKAANNAEARERQMKASYEKNLDTFDPDGDKGAEATRLLPDDAPGGETLGVPPVRVAVAANGKEQALRAKWLG